MGFGMMNGAGFMGGWGGMAFGGRCHVNQEKHRSDWKRPAMPAGLHASTTQLPLCGTIGGSFVKSDDAGR